MHTNNILPDQVSFFLLFFSYVSLPTTLKYINNAMATTSNGDNNNVCCHFTTKDHGAAGGDSDSPNDRVSFFFFLHFFTLLISTYNRLCVRRGTGLIGNTIATTSKSDDDDGHVSLCHDQE